MTRLSFFTLATLKAGLVCLAFIAASMGDAVAKPSDKCSARGQKPCPAIYKGERCDPGLSEQRGTCQPCGGRNQKACPKIKRGYPCRGKLEPDSAGICRPCGGNNQKACRALKPGARCNSGLVNIRGTCKSCGGPDEIACPKIKRGYPCRGQYEPNANGICKPCGGIDQKACRALKPGKRCDDGDNNKDTRIGNIDGICRRCGIEDHPACPRIVSGYPCVGKFEPDDNDICRPCGGLGQRRCRALKEGRQCDAGLEHILAKGTCEPSPNHVEDPIEVFNRSRSDVFVTAHWILPDGEMWTMETGEVAAGGSRRFPIAGRTTCYPERMNPNDANTGESGIIQGLLQEQPDSCEGQNFQVLFWDRKSDFTKWAAENVTVRIAVFLAVDYLLGKVSDKVTGGLLPIPGAEEASEFAGDLWADMRDPDGTLKTYGVHDWAWNVPQERGQVVYWGKGIKSDAMLNDGQPAHPRDLVAPGQRSPSARFYALYTNPQGETVQVPLDCSGMCPNPDYGSNTTRSHSTHAGVRSATGSSSATATAATASTGSAQEVTGDWTVRVKGRDMTHSVVRQTADYIIVRHGRKGKPRRYDRVRDMTFRDKKGSTYRFVNGTRGLWISANGNKVRQMEKK